MDYPGVLEIDIDDLTETEHRYRYLAGVAKPNILNL
jgi:hypothetical protein